MHDPESVNCERLGVTNYINIKKFNSSRNRVPTYSHPLTHVAIKTFVSLYDLKSHVSARTTQKGPPHRTLTVSHLPREGAILPLLRSQY